MSAATPAAAQSAKTVRALLVEIDAGRLTCSGQVVIRRLQGAAAALEAAAATDDDRP